MRRGCARAWHCGRTSLRRWFSFFAVAQAPAGIPVRTLAITGHAMGAWIRGCTTTVSTRRTFGWSSVEYRRRRTLAHLKPERVAGLILDWIGPADGPLS